MQPLLQPLMHQYGLEAFRVFPCRRQEKTGTVPVNNELFPHLKILKKACTMFYVVVGLFYISCQIDHSL
jgi:hypothetical protein